MSSTHLEYHSVCPLVRIGTPHTLSRKRVSPPPGIKEAGGTHSPTGEGVGGGVPIRRQQKKPGTLSTLWWQGSKQNESTRGLKDRAALCFTFLNCHVHGEDTSFAVSHTQLCYHPNIPSPHARSPWLGDNVDSGIMGLRSTLASGCPW